MADKERLLRGMYKSRQSLNNARLSGWAAKKYGNDWQDYRDPEEVANEFQAWLEQRGHQ